MIASAVALEVFSGVYCGVADMSMHVYEEGTSLKAIQGLYE
jgi:hypothetical protein